MSEDTISVREAVEMYLAATGSSPSLEPQVLAELREPGTLPLNLLGDPLPYFIKDGEPMVERARFEELMARVRGQQHKAART